MDTKAKHTDLQMGGGEHKRNSHMQDPVIVYHPEAPLEQ